MPELDPAWEYATCDPEIYEAVYGHRQPDGFERIDIPYDEKDTGFRFGNGRSIDRMNFRMAPDRKPTKESKFLYNRRCVKCGKSYSPKHDGSKFCSKDCVDQTRRTIPAVAQCEKCGKDYRPAKVTSRYCSIKCYGGSIRRLPDFFTCTRCGDLYRPSRWKSVLCGSKCRGSKRTLADVTCGTCGKVYRPDHAVSKYCSVKCVPRPGGVRKLPDRICVCGKVFRAFKRKQRFCSMSCGGKVGAPKPPPLETLERFAQAYLGGRKMTDLSAEFGVTICQLKRWRRSLGLTARPIGNPKRRRK